MAAPRVTIPELPETISVPANGLVIVEDAGVTKKMSTSLLASNSSLDAHLIDPSDAHVATAIGATPSTTLSAGDVQGQLDQASAAIAGNTAQIGNHLSDTVDAHAASAVSFVPTGTIAATTVQDAIVEIAAEAGAGGGGSGTITSINGDVGPVVSLIASEIPFTPEFTVGATQVQAAITEVATDGANALNSHFVNSVAHAASSITFAPTGTILATTVQAAINEVEFDASSNLNNHLAQPGAHTASNVTFTPTGTIAATTVQAAIAEVAAEASAQTIATVAATTYTVVAADAGKLVRLTATATVTLPAAGIAVGERVDFVCIGGAATFALSGSTWDVPPTPSAVARAIGSFVTAIKMGATSWALVGDLA